MNWSPIVARVAPYIVKIETPSGSGTGFICMKNGIGSLVGIATALHVVDYADSWQQPIKIVQQSDGKRTFFNARDVIVFRDWKRDSAMLLVPTEGLDLPDEFIPLLSNTVNLDLGVEVGWLGYPGIAGDTLCFFSGSVSARQGWRNAYLIDGTAISGVSGGPVIYSTEADGVQIVGADSAYQPNRTATDTLPGLSIVQDVSHFHEVIDTMRSIDEAAEKKNELEKQRATEPPEDGEQPQSGAA